MKERLELIFTREEISRITEGIRDGREILTVDLHGLRVKEARRFLLNIMSATQGKRDLYVIHGYVHGTAIKEMVQRDLKSTSLSSKESVKGNYGVTILKMKKAA